jgi:hypothetical protein
MKTMSLLGAVLAVSARLAGVMCWAEEPATQAGASPQESGVAAASVPSDTARLVTYPAPAGEPLSADYELTVNGQKVDVYTARTLDPPFAGKEWDFGGAYSFVNFDLSGRAELRIRSPRSLAKTVIRPASAALQVAHEDDHTLRLVLDGPRKLSIEPNGKKGPLLLFANPIEKNPPKANDAGVICYGPGIHKAGKITVRDNQTLYLAGGAVVHGAIAAQGMNIRICGRGILDGSDYEWCKGPHPYTIGIYGSDIELDGITVRGSPHWTIVPRDSRRVTIRNVKICNSRVQNDDGINPCNSQDVRITDCFIRSDDDCIALKGLELKGENNKVEDIVVENCILWCDRARVFLLGHESRAEFMRRVAIRDLDILHFSTTAFLLEPGEDMRLEDVCIEDVRVHGEGQGELLRLRPVVNQYMRKKVPGFVRNVRFKNVSVAGAPGEYVVQLEGADAEHDIRDVVFENVTVNGQPLAEGQGRLRIGTHVEGVRLGNTPIMKTIDFEDVTPEGLLKETAKLSFAHLQDGYFQWESISKVNFEPFPGDAIGRCINGLTLLSRALHQPAPASLHEIVKRSAELHNSDGYLGPQLPESRANEDVLAAHNGYACGLSEYVQWTGDAKATETLKRMSANLFVPARKAISLYRENSDAAAKLNWHLSGGDIGQLFLLLDGITRSYVQVPSPELKATIETMIARYHELDLVKISAQTHAMLSATTGILRWYELQHRPEDLAFAEALYKQYRDLAMTETYENFNWFNRPEWTEGCAVIDSYILTVNLWRLTGKVSYLEDAHLILFNGLLPGQLRNGGFGTSPCVGAHGICRAKEHVEAPFCCSMRGGEGLARAIQYSYFMDRDTVVLAFYSGNTATLRFSDGACKVRETTKYPYEGKVRLEVVESQVGKEKAFRFFVPSWVKKNSVQVTVNGVKVEPSLAGSFAEITVKPAAGTVVEVLFDQEAGPRPALHPEKSPGAVRYFRGPLLLGSTSDDAAEPLTPLLDIFDPAKGTGGEPYVFFPRGKAHPAMSTAAVSPPGDCSRQAHVFRRDAPADKVPREVAPLFAALKFDRASAICGFLWDEPQEVKQVILQWPENAAMPKPEEVAVRWSDSGKMNDAPQPGIIGNGRQWVYIIRKSGKTIEITNLLVSVKQAGVKPDKFGIPAVRILNHP